MDKMIRLCNNLSWIVGWISGYCGMLAIFLMTALITIDIIGRYLGTPTNIADEISGYMLVGVTFLGLAFTQRNHRHIRIMMLFSRFSEKVQKYLLFIIYSISIIVICWLIWATFDAVIMNYTFNRISITSSRIPMWIPWLIVPVGLTMFNIELLLQFIKILFTGKTSVQAQAGEDLGI